MQVYKCAMHILCEHELLQTVNEIHFGVDKTKNKNNLVYLIFNQ